jgi:hypothetical protein
MVFTGGVATAATTKNADRVANAPRRPRPLAEVKATGGDLRRDTTGREIDNRGGGITVKNLKFWPTISARKVIADEDHRERGALIMQIAYWPCPVIGCHRLRHDDAAGGQIAPKCGGDSGATARMPPRMISALNAASFKKTRSPRWCQLDADCRITS